MKQEWIDRYIYAVTRRLPQKLRADVEKELAGLIADMLEARCGAVTPTEKDIRIVLTELGPPEDLAAKYSGDEAKALISGTYLLLYKRILKIVLPIAAAGIAFASVLAMLLEWNPELNPFVAVAKAFGQVIGGAVGGTVQAFAVITFIFAVLEHKKVTLANGDIFASLQPVPKKGERIRLHEPIVNIAWSVLAATLFLGFPQIAGAWLEGVGWIPAFSAEVIRSLWLPILLWAVLAIAKECVKLVDGNYTRRVAIATVIANPLIMISAVLVFRQGRILNPEFLDYLGQLLVGEGGQVLVPIFQNLHLLLLGIILFALIIDTITICVKAWKYNRQQ